MAQTGSRELPATPWLPGLSVELRPAPPFKRLLAVVIDLGIYFACVYAGLLIFLAGFLIMVTTMVPWVNWLIDRTAYPVLDFLRQFTSSGLEEPKWVGVIFVLLIMIVILIVVVVAQTVFFVSWEVLRGATPGKKLLGLRVCDRSGARMSFWQAIVRDLSRWFELATIVPAAMTIGLTPRRQRLGDLLSGTYVFHSPMDEQAQAHLYLPWVDYEPLLALANISSVLPARQRDSFLRFAYSYFITSEWDGVEVELSDWSRFIAECCPGLSENFDRRLRFRFFAEYCFQSRLRELKDPLA